MESRITHRFDSLNHGRIIGLVLSEPSERMVRRSCRNSTRFVPEVRFRNSMPPSPDFGSSYNESTHWNVFEKSEKPPALPKRFSGQPGWGEIRTFSVLEDRVSSTGRVNVKNVPSGEQGF